jgi:YVTN family beta-propeller protein
MKKQHQWGALASLFLSAFSTQAGQVPGPASAPEIPTSGRDRVYAGEQFSNTVSVIDPQANRLLGVIRLGEPQPTNFTPLYRGQLLVHGLGFSPDHKTLAVVAIGSNSVSFIDTHTNLVKHVTYVGRSPHEAFFTNDGAEVWVAVRGEDYIAVLDGRSYQEKAHIATPNGPGMTIFSPDGRLAYVCSSFVAEVVVFDVASRHEVGRVVQPSAFCPNIAATPDGTQVWITLKDSGKVMVFAAQPPFNILKTLDTGAITNHVNIVRNRNGQFAYVTVGGLNQVIAFRTADFAEVARIAVGNMPHGAWPSGDGARLYVGIENDDKMTAIDTLKNVVVADIPIGQAPQAVVYVPDAVTDGDGTANLQPLGLAGEVAKLHLAAPRGGKLPQASVSLFDQGLVQVMQAAVTGLEPKCPYVLALADRADGSGALQPLASFSTNPRGAAIVNASGPIRQLVQMPAAAAARYLVVAPGTPGHVGTPVAIQTP